MQTIVTKYAGPTNTKGSRVIAKCWIKSKTFEWQYAGNAEENHKRAAVKLVELLNDDRKKAEHDDYVWKVIASGSMPDNSGNAYIIDLMPNTEKEA